MTPPTDEPKGPLAPPDDEEKERETFASAVEDYFLRRRGSSVLLPAKDWALIASWFEERIPLGIVLSGIAEVFDRHIAAGRIEPVSSVSYCRHAVRKRWKEHQVATTGGAESVALAKRRKKKSAVDDPVKRLHERFFEAASRLDESAPAVAEAIRALLPEIERLEADDSSPLSDREAILIEMERGFAREILGRLAPGEREALEAEAEAPLARLRVPPPVEEIERLRELGRLRAVRHRFLLPRFTLLPR